MAYPGYPVQIQADNVNADDSRADVMCHVFDRKSLRRVFAAMMEVYLHVIAWDCDGNIVEQYDNR